MFRVPALIQNVREETEHFTKMILRLRIAAQKARSELATCRRKTPNININFNVSSEIVRVRSDV